MVGKQRQPKHGLSKHVESAAILTGTVTPVLILANAWLIAAGVSPATSFLAGTDILQWFPLTYAGIVLVLSWLVVYRYAKTRQYLGTYLIIYHLVLASYLVIVSGFVTPLVLLWVLLYITTNVYYGTIRGYFSLGLLVVTALLSAGIASEPDVSAIHNLIWVVVVVVVGELIMQAVAGLETDKLEVERAREAAATERSQTKTLINNLADAIISTDPNGIILVYNSAVLNLLDTNAELQGSTIDHILSLTNSDKQSVKLLDILHETDRVTMRDDLTAAISGEPTRLELTCTPVRDSFRGNGHDRGVTGYIIIMRDITKSKSLEEERDEFISVISHELRTPLTIAEGTIGNVQVMMKRSDMPKAKLTQAIELAHDQVVFLSSMVNDLGTLSRAERGVADAGEDIDTMALVNDLFNEYAAEARAKGLSFDLNMPGTISHLFVSRLYLKELLQNFVTNAIKYTHAGGITIEVKQSKGKVNFAVRDTGIGISHSDQSRIFDKFYRAEDYRTRETSGTGLGLYVTTKLARKLGTTIELKSRLNHGSTFSFSLSVDKSS